MALETAFSRLAGLGSGPVHAPTMLTASPDFRGEAVPLSYVAHLLNKKTEVVWDRGGGRVLSSKTPLGSCRIAALVAFAIMAKRNLARDSDVTLRDAVMFVHPLARIVSRIESTEAGCVTGIVVTFVMNGRFAPPFVCFVWMMHVCTLYVFMFVLSAANLPPVEIAVRRAFKESLFVCGVMRDLAGTFAAAMFIALLAKDAFIKQVMERDPQLCSLRYLFGRISFDAAVSMPYGALELAMLKDGVGMPEIDMGEPLSRQWEWPSKVLMLPPLEAGLKIDELVRAVAVRKRALGLVASSDKFQGMSLWQMRLGAGMPVASLGMGAGGAIPGNVSQGTPVPTVADVTGMRETDDAFVRAMLLRFHPIVNAAVEQATEILRRAGEDGQQQQQQRGQQRQQARGRRRSPESEYGGGGGGCDDDESAYGGSRSGGGQPQKRRKNAAAQEAERIYNVLMASRFNLRDRVMCEEDVGLASRKLLELGFSRYVTQAISAAYWWVANPSSAAVAGTQKRSVRTTGDRLNMCPTVKDLARMREESQRQRSGSGSVVFGCAVGERVCHKEKEFITQEEFYPKSWVVTEVDDDFVMVDMPVADVSHETRSTSLQNIRVYLMTHLNCVVTRRRSSQCVFCMAGFCVDLEEDDPDMRAIRELEKATVFPDVRQLGTWLVNRMSPVAVQPHLVCFRDGVYDLIARKFTRFDDAVKAQRAGVVADGEPEARVVLECFGGICATDYTAFSFADTLAAPLLVHLTDGDASAVLDVCGATGAGAQVPATLGVGIEEVRARAGRKALPANAPWWCQLIPIFCHLVDPSAFVDHSSPNNVAAWLGLLGAIMVPRRFEYEGEICDMYNMLLFLIGNSGAGKTVFSRFLKMMLTEAGAGERNTAGLFSDSGSRFALSLFNTDRYRKLTICNEISTGTGGLLNRDAICKFADQEAQETEFKGSSIAGQVVVRSTLLLMGNHFPHANVGLLDTAPMRRIVCFDWATPRELDGGAEKAFHAELPVILVLASWFYSRMRAVSRDNIFTALTGVTCGDYYRDFLAMGLGTALCRAPCSADEASARHIRLGRFFRWIGQNVVPLHSMDEETEEPADVDTLLKAWARYELVYYSHIRAVGRYMRRVTSLKAYRDASLCPHGHFASAHLEQVLITRFGERPEDVRAGVTRKVRFFGADAMSAHEAIALRYVNRGRHRDPTFSEVRPSAFDVMMSAASSYGEGSSHVHGGKRTRDDADALFVGGGFEVPLPDTIGEGVQQPSATLWDDIKLGDEDEPVDGWTDAPGTVAVRISGGTSAVCVGRFESLWRLRDRSSDTLWRVEAS